MSCTIYMLNNSDNQNLYPGQMNSFIVETKEGELVVIDGGYDSECEHLLNQLRQISGERKPTVAGWFLTHPHRDHIGCFMDIITKYSECIEISCVYYNFPSIQFLQHEERAFDVIKNFYHLLPCFADIAVIVTEGDCYEIGGATFEILYSGNPAWTDNAGNNSSLVIRLTMEGKKMLFLGDIGIEAGEQLLNKYGPELKSDYCQMAHHGQSGVDKNVYQAIAPDTCLWCAPVWLWNNDIGDGYNTYTFQTVEVRNWMNEIGAQKHYVMKDGDQMIELSM